jgi:hypothetical protein
MNNKRKMKKKNKKTKARKCAYVDLAVRSSDQNWGKKILLLVPAARVLGGGRFSLSAYFLSGS